MSNRKREKFLELFKLFIKGFSVERVSEITGMNANTVAQNKFKLVKFINEFVANGELQGFIKANFGKDINFPDNKFSFDIGKKSAESPEAEPLQIWRQKEGSNEPGDGEWVDMSTGRKGAKSRPEQGGADMFVGGGYDGGTQSRNPDEEEPGIEEPFTPGEQPDERDLYREMSKDDLSKMIKKIFFK